MAQRTTFVLDRDGRVARSFFDVTPRGHAQQILNFVRTMLESHRMLGG
jgi:peroxiredoxin